MLATFGALRTSASETALMMAHEKTTAHEHFPAQATHARERMRCACRAGLQFALAICLVAIGWVGMPRPASADMVTYTTSLQGGNMCTGCGPFGTVTVSGVSGQPDELSVTLTLDPGEVFAKTGAGAALLFDISGNPPLSVMSLLPSGYGFTDSPTHADGSGNWNSYIACTTACGSGTSLPQNSGPISFLLKSTGPLTPQSFVTNGPNGTGYLFASDIGVPNGSGGYFTGDVVTSGPLSPVPLPAAAWLLISGLAGVRVAARGRSELRSA